MAKKLYTQAELNKAVREAKAKMKKGGKVKRKKRPLNANMKAVNKARKSKFRNAIKKMNLLIDSKKKSDALKFLPKLNSELMKVAKTGIIKRQTASRNVSRITKKISAL